MAEIALAVNKDPLYTHPLAPARSRKLTRSKIEEAYQLWKDTQNIDHLTRELGLSRPTIIQLVKRQNWNTRLRIELAAEAEAGTGTLEAAKSGTIADLTRLSNVALRHAMKGGFKSARESSMTFFEARRLQLELLGHLAPKDAGILTIMARKLKALDEKRKGALDPTKEITEAQSTEPANLSKPEVSEKDNA